MAFSGLGQRRTNIGITNKKYFWDNTCLSRSFPFSVIFHDHGKPPVSARATAHNGKSHTVINAAAKADNDRDQVSMKHHAFWT